MYVGDDDLSTLETFQLDAFERMQAESSKYVWRVVERVSFLPIGGQQWERQIQLCLPSLPDIPPHKHRRDNTSQFIVSLGTFRRRRFADFMVTTDDGSQCRLLTRRQHGYCLATCFLRQFILPEEWKNLDQSTLGDFHSYLASMITAVPSNENYTALGARKLLDELFRASGIMNCNRQKAAHKMLSIHCELLARQTQYLCWVAAQPGSAIHLRATYTQADSPSPRYEPEPESDGVTNVRLRLWWRNWRTREYARYNVFPLRYSFDTPSYDDCQSYYFTITPPLDTRITLLNWGSGNRFRTAVENTGWDKKKYDSQEEPKPPDGIAEELDCASFGYHFHNRRRTQRRRKNRRNPKSNRWWSPDRRRSSDRRWPRPDRRRHGTPKATRLHVFLRPDPADNGKLIATGFLGLALAVLAERGALLGGGGTSQWLLLAPAVLVLFVSQQQRHHYARFTKRYRFSVWIYIILAMLFAGSVNFDAPAIPLLSNRVSAAVPPFISAIFAIASGILIIASIWSGGYFENTTRKRYKRVLKRVRMFGTPSLRQTLKYRRRPVYRIKLKEPIQVSPNPRNKHPSDKVYTSVARHGIDRAFGFTSLVVLLAMLAMIFHWFNWHWGVGEECAITKQHEQRSAEEEGKSLGKGKCKRGRWRRDSTQTASSTSRSRITPSHQVIAPAPTPARPAPAGSYPGSTASRMHQPS